MLVELHAERQSHVATTYKYCVDCEKLLNIRNSTQGDFIDASVFRPSTDAAGHTHRTQEGTCDTCGKSKEVSSYELSSDSG